ncbi:cryptococcal mannosyltransferase 1-domain-containing protein [Haematococcus lacustris]
MQRVLGAALLVGSLLLLAPLSYVVQDSQPQPTHRVKSLLEIAQRLRTLPGSAQSKRIGLLRALESNNATHQQQHDLPNVAAAFSQTLASLGQHMPCRLDLSLPRSLPSGQHYLVAANLRQNEQLMPHYIKQLLLVLLEHLTETGADHDGTLLVSIYESGSTDATPQYLAVLEVLLEALGVPHTITAAGQLSRLGAERIHFLAKVRNTALLPLWHSSTGVGADTAGLEHLLAALQEALGCEPDTTTPPLHTPSSSPMASTSPPWPRQSTPGQNHSLSPSHGEDWAGGEEEQRLWALLREVQSRLNVSIQAAAETVAAGSSGSSTSPASSAASSGTSVDGGAGQGPGLQRARARQLLRKSPWLTFYDTWVARDITGQRFHNGFPVVSHGPSAQSLKEGWPFPVTCCWNGLVVLNAEPFRQRGLQFRAHGPGECAASECSLMCDDFWRLGYSRALVDPSVRQTYAPWDPYLYYDNLLGEAVPMRPWSNLLQHAAQQGWYHPTPPTPLTEKQAPSPPSPVFEPLPATSNATNNSIPSSTVPSNSSSADTGGSEFVMSGGDIDQAKHPEVKGSTPGFLTWLHRMVGGLQSSTSGPSLHAAPAADSSASNQAPQLPGAGRAGLRQERHKRLRLRQQEQPVETDHPLGKAGPRQAALHVLHRRGGRMKLEQRQLKSPVRLPPPPDPVQGLWQGVEAPATQVCCDKHAIADWVDFGACQARPFLEPNHTATALVALKNRDLAQLKQWVKGA